MAKSSMNVSRLGGSCVEIYKTLNDLNQNFMKDLSKLRKIKPFLVNRYK